MEMPFGINIAIKSKNNCGRVMIVEGALDAMRAHYYRQPCVAAMGAIVSNYQAGMISDYFHEAIIAPDNDDAGKRMLGQARPLLEYVLGAKVYVVKYPTGVKDIGEMTHIQFQELMKTQKHSLCDYLERNLHA